MYGTVNQAIEKHITKNFGKEKWQEIKLDASVSIDVFQSNDPYDDNITFNLVDSTSKILNLPKESVLFESGKCWVLDIGVALYRNMIIAAGNSFKEFMLNVPNFQSRLQLLYPKMNPPEFVIHSSDKEMRCEYHSNRDGFTPFIIGSIYAVGDFYKTKIDLKQLHYKSEKEFDLFKISWK